MISHENSSSTKVEMLEEGVYQFELVVTDINEATAKDTVKVTVNQIPNIPPIADAQSDKNITLPVNNVTLQGSGTDADGNIVSFNWRKIYGPDNVAIKNATSVVATATDLSAGIYQFELAVTDNNGAVARDTVEVTVNEAISIPPTVYAGDDQTIRLPLNTVALYGTGQDSDASITSYQWRKISGPATYSIDNASLANTNINGLIQGIYLFELSAVDSYGAKAKDTVQIAVKPAVSIVPVADAGCDVTLTLPISSVSLRGAGTDVNGIIIGYLWKQISGPTESVIYKSNSATATVKNLVNGTYEFELTVTDNMGAIGKDTIIVTAALSKIPALENSIRIYPNPVKDIALLEINTSNPNGSNLTIVMSDISGKIVYRQNKAAQESQFIERIDLSMCAKGVYTLSVSFNDNKSKQIIKLVKL